MMLNWLGETNAAQQLEDAVIAVLEEGMFVTPDLGGKAKTIEMAQAIISKL
jgi:isocitrate/isopropylmalate dehydrogenase